MKLIDDNYACSSLTNFEFKLNATTGNGNYENLLKLGWKKFVKSLQLNLFLAGLRHMEPLCDKTSCIQNCAFQDYDRVKTSA